MVILSKVRKQNQSSSKRHSSKGLYDTDDRQFSLHKVRSEEAENTASNSKTKFLEFDEPDDQPLAEVQMEKVPHKTGKSSRSENAANSSLNQDNTQFRKNLLLKESHKQRRNKKGHGQETVDDYSLYNRPPSVSEAGGVGDHSPQRLAG